MQLDPLNLKNNLALVYRNARRLSAHFNLSIAYQDMGKYDLWLQEWEKYATAANDREDLAVAEDAARVYRKSGYQAALRQIIAREEELAVVSEFCSNYRRRGSGVVAPRCRSLLAESCVAADTGFGLWVRK